MVPAPNATLVLHSSPGFSTTNSFLYLHMNLPVNLGYNSSEDEPAILQKESSHLTIPSLEGDAVIIIKNRKLTKAVSESSWSLCSATELCNHNLDLLLKNPTRQLCIKPQAFLSLNHLSLIKQHLLNVFFLLLEKPGCTIQNTLKDTFIFLLL